MDKIRIGKEMAALIENLRQYTGLLESGSPISQSELSEMQKKIADLQRNASVLDYITNLKAAVDRGEMDASKALGLKEEKEPELIKRNAEPEIEVKPEEIKSPELTEKTVVSEVKLPVAEIPIAPVPEAKPKQEEKPAPVNEAPKANQPDLFGGDLPPASQEPAKEKPKEKPKENPKAAEKPQDDKSLVTKLQKKPIADLKSAIGINEKFQFINELFGGNMTEYNIAVNQVNICSSREEAEAYLDTLRDLYKWKPDNEAVMSFSELVERRFL